MITTNWTDIYDELIVTAFKAGQVKGVCSGQPTEVMESGLAHIFFFNDVVYKLYKTHADKDHFIKGVLAPTKRRQAFIEHDFAVNSHFSQSVYKQIHSVYYSQDEVAVVPFDGNSIYTLVEMSRLDFSQNLHTQLLLGPVPEESLYQLGQQIAQAIDTSPLKAPETSNWYDIASKRVALLTQFIDWLPEEYKTVLVENEVITVLLKHLEENKAEYKALTGEQLSVNVDNHDENVFIQDGVIVFIDLLPPMDSWWYGLPFANLANVMVNVEVMQSPAAAQAIQRGYLQYHGITELPAHSFGFTKAFAHIISIAHFGSVPGKEAVTKRYLTAVPEIHLWLK